MIAFPLADLNIWKLVEYMHHIALFHMSWKQQGLHCSDSIKSLRGSKVWRRLMNWRHHCEKHTCKQNDKRSTLTITEFQQRQCNNDQGQCNLTLQIQYEYKLHIIFGHFRSKVVCLCIAMVSRSTPSFPLNHWVKTVQEIPWWAIMKNEYSWRLCVEQKTLTPYPPTEIQAFILCSFFNLKFLF